MKFHASARIVSCILAGILGFSGMSIASADVFHRFWIRGPIFDTYVRLGGHGFFGDAVGPEAQLSDGGKAQHFERDTSIYWKSNVSGGVSRQVGGAIRQRWAQAGWQEGSLGYPVTDENGLPERFGRYNHFENGSIYWSPETGARIVSGRIRDYWASRGWERSHLGLPVGDAYGGFGSLTQQFENGSVRVVPAASGELPAHTIRPHSSYEMTLPILPADVGVDSLTAHLTPAGLNQHVIRDFGAYFPFSGCSGLLVAGKVCNLTTVAGRTEPIEVVHVDDEGFALRTGAGSPEGEGRLITFEFVLLEAGYSRGDLVHADRIRELAWVATRDKPWVGLRVKSSGPIAGAQWAGPFNNRRLAAAAWAKMTANTVLRLPSMDTVFLVEGIPSLEDLIRVLEIGHKSGPIVKENRSPNLMGDAGRSAHEELENLAPTGQVPLVEVPDTVEDIVNWPVTNLPKGGTDVR